jgi:hypothetical protein
MLNKKIAAKFAALAVAAAALTAAAATGDAFAQAHGNQSSPSGSGGARQPCGGHCPINCNVLGTSANPNCPVGSLGNPARPLIIPGS